MQNECEILISLHLGACSQVTEGARQSLKPSDIKMLEAVQTKELIHIL
jgi:hypothetical protein